jgi:hypothetical protein
MTEKIQTQRIKLLADYQRTLDALFYSRSQLILYGTWDGEIKIAHQKSLRDLLNKIQELMS